MNLTHTHIFIKNFLRSDSYILNDLPVDASFRQYTRVTHGNSSYILMKAPQQHYRLQPFITVANLLNSNGFSAPLVYEVDHEQGLMILEDFSNKTIKDYLLQNPTDRLSIYKRIIDTLIGLQQISISSQLSIITIEELLKQLEIFLDWYLSLVTKTITSTQRKEFLQIWQELLNGLPHLKPCLTLWDYHTENMMLLDRPNVKSIGLLDFQDAVIASPLYDLVSVLEDARIDVSKDLANQMFDYYLSETNIDKEKALEHYHLLGAQRNLRIMGVFARKYLRDQNDSYLQYIPRVKNYLINDLSHPKLALIKKTLEDII